jgi:S-phase kinase-associated protein 1
MVAEIRIQSSDKEEFTVSINVAKKMNTIRTMLEDLGIEDDEENEVKETLPLTTIEGKVLKKVIEWCEKRINDKEPNLDKLGENPDGSRKIRQLIETDNWDKSFLAVEIPFLMDIIRAANYLHVPGLIELTCSNVARMLKGSDDSK